MRRQEAGANIAIGDGPKGGGRDARSQTSVVAREARLAQTTEYGEMAEWFKAAVLKTAVGLRPPWVRIPLSPPDMQKAPFGAFCMSAKRVRGRTRLVRQIRLDRIWTAEWLARSAQRGG